jgi:aspartyl-tRNA(Asn)/glutamyl-tRNA(Gln) amidotransferase subunit C
MAEETTSVRIDEETVRAIARLARMDLTPNEVASFSKQFTDIIRYFHLLDDAQVDDVLPAYLLTIREGEMRPDVTQPGIEREEFLAQAPVREGNQIKVAPVLNAEDEE